MSRPGRKRNLSSEGIRKKVNPNAPQHRSWSRPAEGRKEIPQTPNNPPKSEKSEKSERGFIGNHEWMWNFIIWEDAKPFNDYADFFSMNNSLS